MKRALIIALLLVSVIGLSNSAFAGMDDRDFSVQVIDTATNTQSFVLRGALDAVYVDVPTGATGTVTVTHSPSGVANSETLFTLADIAADAVYYPRAAMHTTAGASATWNAYSTTWTESTTTNTVTTYYGASPTNATANTVLTYKLSPSDSAAAQTVYGKQSMAGTVTVSVIGQSSGTNTYAVTLVYEK